MQIFIDLITNPVLISACAGWFVAQLLKVIFHFIKYGPDWKRIAGGGGMPSSHSATVIGLTTATAITYGVGGFEFPMALFLAIIVIYDAMGVRLETGKEAAILNRLMERDKAEGKAPVQEKKLDEFMGHTFPEIVAGVVIGIVCGIVVCKIISMV